MCALKRNYYFLLLQRVIIIPTNLVISGFSLFYLNLFQKYKKSTLVSLICAYMRDGW